MAYTVEVDSPTMPTVWPIVEKSQPQRRGWWRTSLIRKCRYSDVYQIFFFFHVLGKEVLLLNYFFTAYAIAPIHLARHVIRAAALPAGCESHLLVTILGFTFKSDPANATIRWTQSIEHLHIPSQRHLKSRASRALSSDVIKARHRECGVIGQERFCASEIGWASRAS